MSRIIKKSIKVILLVAFVAGGALGIVYGIQAYPDVFNIQAKVERWENIKPDEEIRINFSQAVLTNSYKGKISITPRENVLLHWENSNKTLVLSPKKLWKTETDYVINLEQGKSKLLGSIKEQELVFSTIKNPSIKKVFPDTGAQDVVFDIEDPIIVDFEKPFDDFWINFNFSPSIEFAYQINPEKTQFKIIPKEPVKEGTKFDMAVNARYAKDEEGRYKEIFTTNFETLPPHPETWEKDLTLRVEQAKKLTRAQIKEGKYIDINLASQIMAIFENGQIIDAFVISSGKRGMDTPKGTFKIENKSPRPWSKKYSLFMPNWMAIVPSGEFGIHELPEWPGGYKEGQNHLGTPVSHGCVRLGVGPSKQVYDWAEMGTPVIIY